MAVRPSESRVLKKQPAHVLDTITLHIESVSVLVQLLTNDLVINIHTVPFPVCTRGPSVSTAAQFS